MTLVVSFLLVSGAFPTAESGLWAAASNSHHIAPIPRTPIQHIVIIMQENHAFDNYFGTFPGLKKGYSENLSVCMPVVINSSNGCVKPFNGDNNVTAIQSVDLHHNWNHSHEAFNNGSMNGFITNQIDHAGKVSPGDAVDTMAYYTNATLPNYWDYASYYALDANFFSSTLDDSLPNHYYLVAGRADNIMGIDPLDFNLTYPTIINQLDDHNISWKFYQGAWNDSWDCTSDSNESIAADTDGYNAYWGPLADFPAVQQNQTQVNNVPVCDNLLNDNDLMQNITSGYLPNVTWITPDLNDSEHPGVASSLAGGQLYTTSIINAISNSPLWNTTAIFLTWDEFGGYYDGAVPTQFDAYGYGFRVPLLVISPYVMPGRIFYGRPIGVQEDFTALLSTIEYNWRLSNLTARDAEFDNGIDKGLFYMFNFKQQPLQALILPSNILATYPYGTCGTCYYGPAMPYSSAHPPTYPVPGYDPVDLS